MKTKQGSGLIFAVVLLFVILGMVVTLSSITVLETKMSQKTKSSVGAFYNSEAGVEWALNQISTNNGDIFSAFRATGFDGPAAKCPASFGSGGDICKVLFLGADGKVLPTSADINEIEAVRSVGTQNTGETTQRAIEAAVAGTDCKIVSSTCASADCQTNCPAGYNVIAGGWWGIMYENIDQNRPVDNADGTTGWKVVDSSYLSGNTNTIYATCCRY